MAPLASDVAGFCRRFGLRAAAVYGMSEIGAVLDGPPETVVGGEAGFPRAEYELRVVDAGGQDAAAGEIGELWVRPQDPRLVMRGYHNLPGKRPRPSSTAGCTPATRSGSTPRAASSSPTG